MGESYQIKDQEDTYFFYVKNMYDQKEGKRAFRVYPSWDITNNKQAARTQKWQLNYFYKVDEADLKRVIKLYNED